MKKFLSLALALTLCTSLAACSSGGNTSGSSSGSDNTSGSGSGSSSQTQTSDMQYVKDKGTLVVGITYFAPMDYKEEGSDEWIGFDADMAKAFAESLGVNVEFQEITWDYKVDGAQLQGHRLRVERHDPQRRGHGRHGHLRSLLHQLSNPVVYPADKAADFEGLTSLEGLNIAVESGSAGEDAAEALGATTVPVQAQANALMEVSAGTSDAAVIDVLMAAEMTGEGTSYADLVYSLNLNDAQGLHSEEYGVGFRRAPTWWMPSTPSGLRRWPTAPCWRRLPPTAFRML